jgi:diacylglycerol kinase family enzyme/membrane-associated phospholipid phosphatase
VLSILTWAGRLADHSKLWSAVAFVLAAFGGRFGRRAALRGMISVAVSSVLVTGVLKRVIRRARPSPSPERASARFPSSGSFPSGHAASAFAFATAVSLEEPAFGLPLFAAAGTVAYSRTRTGVHYPSDVLAGAAMGAGIALATLRYWPLAPKTPARAAAAEVDPSSVPDPDGRGLVVVVNPEAGPAVVPNPARRLRRMLPAARIVVVGEEEPLEEVFAKESGGATCLGVAGGDGSVSVAAKKALELGRPLAVFPTGTLNNFAKDLGLHSVEDTVEAIQQARTAAVDVATLHGDASDGRTFVNTASFGAYVDLVRVRERLEDRIGKWPAVLVALTRVFRSANPLCVEIDGRARRVWMVFVGNCRLRPDGFAPTWRDRMDDGELDIRTIDASERFSRARLVWAVLTGGMDGSRVYERRRATEVHVRPLDGPLRLTCDGETFEGPDDFVIRKSTVPVTVFVPPEVETQGPPSA